jgi:hypothetical protein
VFVCNLATIFATNMVIIHNLLHQDFSLLGSSCEQTVPQISPFQLVSQFKFYKIIIIILTLIIISNCFIIEYRCSD